MRSPWGTDETHFSETQCVVYQAVVSALDPRLCSPPFYSASDCLAYPARREWPRGQQDGGRGGTCPCSRLPVPREQPLNPCPPQLQWWDPVESGLWPWQTYSLPPRPQVPAPAEQRPLLRGLGLGPLPPSSSGSVIPESSFAPQS